MSSPPRSRGAAGELLIEVRAEAEAEGVDEKTTPAAAT